MLNKSILQTNNESLGANNLDLQALIDQANALPDAGGVELPELTNEGSASDLLSGKQLIDQDGNVVTGTIATKNSSNLTASGATVTVPAGYYASNTTKSVATATQAIPSISINSSGLIIASATQSAGYVSAGTKSGIKQLTTQAAKTITPTKSSQTAVASGVYTTGAVTVAAIPSQYITTTDATASADEIMSGETAYVNGSKVTGTFSIDSELNTQDSLISQIQTALAGKAAGGGEQATPVISINANGLITATAGAKSSTHQLAFQAAQTITPTIANQIAVSSGYYTGGNIIVAGDTNLVASNIKSGVSIFGVSGTLVEGGGSGDGYDEADSLITRTFSTYTNSRVSSIGAGAFYGHTSLVSVNFPNCINIGGKKFAGAGGYNGAFAYCTALTTISFPACTSISTYAFYYCASLTTVNFPVCTTIGSNAFNDCKNLTTISFPVCTSVGNEAFHYCYSLTTVNFPACTTIGSNAFVDCSSLTTASFPVCTSIGSNAFSSCRSLTTVSFPVCTSIYKNAFRSCPKLTTASFPACTSIGREAFRGCYNLESLYLTNSIVCTLSDSNAFTSTPIGGYSTSAGTYGSIYVPASLLTSYQTATNWTYFSSRFVALGDGGHSGGNIN